MANKITFQELVDQFSENTGRTKAFSNKFIKDVFITIQEGLRKDENVNIKGLGIFKLQEVAERETLNPKTGLSSLIEAHKKIVFRPEKALREKVNEKYADLKPKKIKKKTEEKTESKETVVKEVKEVENSPKSEEPKQELTLDTVLFKNQPASYKAKATTPPVAPKRPILDEETIKSVINPEPSPIKNPISSTASIANPIPDITRIFTDESYIEAEKEIQEAQEKDKIAQENNQEPSTPPEPEVIVEETTPTPIERTPEPQVFVDDDLPEEVHTNRNEAPLAPEESEKLPWQKNDENEIDHQKKIMPTFIIEKNTRRSAWRWLFPLLLIILIFAVLYFVPNRMESLDKIAFWKNWEKITLFERKEQPQKIENKTAEEKSNFFQKAIERYSKNDPATEKAATTINKPIENKAIAETKPVVKSEEEKVLIHIIKSGNTLWGLSKQYYDRTSLWPNIYRKNVETLRTPDFLPVGRELLIPELIGNSYELSKADSARIAQGYYLAYNAYKKYDEAKARGYLKVAKEYSTTIR